MANILKSNLVSVKVPKSWAAVKTISKDKDKDKDQERKERALSDMKDKKDAAGKSTIIKYHVVVMIADFSLYTV